MSISTEKKRILIVEDDATIRGNLVEIMEMLGHDVKAKTNGREASEIFETYNPHLILCDIMMPEMNGFDFLQYINLIHPLHTSLFIFLTAKNDPSDLRTGMNLGADDYITKPFNLADLQEIVHNKLKKQERNFKAIELAKSQSIEHPTLTSFDDFNNNLNNISAGVHYLKFNLKDDDLQVQTILQVIEQSGQKLQRSLDNYLFYQAWIKQKIHLKPDNILEKELKKAIRRLTLMYLREEDLVAEIALDNFSQDPYLLRKIIEELSDNAFKFSKPGTAVVWTIHQVNHFIALDLKYASAGFNELDFEKASAFEKVKQSETASHGLGLGLYLVKEIIQYLGGEIKMNVENNIIHYTIQLKNINA
jgi:two-component system, sensor histidine kinase and response regulator